MSSLDYYRFKQSDYSKLTTLWLTVSVAACALQKGQLMKAKISFFISLCLWLNLTLYHSGWKRRYTSGKWMPWLSHLYSRHLRGIKWVCFFYESDQTLNNARQRRRWKHIKAQFDAIHLYHIYCSHFFSNTFAVHLWLIFRYLDIVAQEVVWVIHWSQGGLIPSSSYAHVEVFLSKILNPKLLPMGKPVPCKEVRLPSVCECVNEWRNGQALCQLT